MNKVLVAGRISRKGVLAYSGEGIAFLDLVLAIPAKEKMNRTEYLPILLKGNAAEECEGVDIGSDVEVEGYLEMETTVGNDAKPSEKIKLFGEKIVESGLSKMNRAQ